LAAGTGGPGIARHRSPYAGAEVALLTQHGKERVIAPALESAVGCRVRHENGFNTDRLGTFAREIARPGSQLEAARYKARIGMELTGMSVGLASEGVFGADPFVGLAPWNAEIIVFIDVARDLEVVGTAEGSATFAHLMSADWTAVESFARNQGFPRQQLILRPESDHDARIRKGLASWAALESAFHLALGESESGRVFVETDGRAHANPTRMANVRRAAEDLGARLGSLCPACGTPGFWLIERIPGLPCESCATPTRESRAEIHGCLRCSYRSTRAVAGRQSAPAACCDECNP
jgi:hypothetical protein